MFGDNEAFFDKFLTCARVRAEENQKLGLNFYTKESSKPIFKKNRFTQVWFTQVKTNY